MKPTKRKQNGDGTASPNGSPSKEKPSSTTGGGGTGGAPPNSATPLSGNSNRSTPSVSAVANSVISAATASTRRVRRGSIVFEASRIESKHFNAKELQNLAKQFNTWTNKHNMMDREGFRKSLGILGMVQDALLCHQLFRVFNRSGTGQINFEEYVHGLGVLMKGTLDEKLDFSFNMTDIDGSGEISFEELVLTVDSMMRIYAGIMGGQAAVLDKERIRNVFAHLDKNHDGKITQDEYKIGMKRHPEFLNTLRGTELFRPLAGSSSSFRAATAKTEKLEIALSDVLQELYRAEDALIALRMMESTREMNGFNSSSNTPDLMPRPGSELGGVLSGTKAGITSSSSSSKLDVEEEEVEQDSGRTTTNHNNVRRDEDGDTTTAGGRDYEEDEDIVDRTEAMHELLSALAKARNICEIHVPHAARPKTVSKPKSGGVPNAVKKSNNSFSNGHQDNSKLTASAPTTPTSVSGGSKFEEEEKTSENGIEKSLSEVNAPANQLAAASVSTTAVAGSQSPMVANASPLPAPPPIHKPLGLGSEIEKDEWAPDEEDASGLPPLPTPNQKARKGLIVYFGHKNWDLVVNVMKGIQMAVSRSAMEQDRPVSPYDFSVKEKYTLVSSTDINKLPTTGTTGVGGGSSSSITDHRTRFVDYAPFVFAKLREHFRIDHEEYMNSIGPGSMLSNLMLGSLSSLAEMGSEGKSGSFFYLSSDGRFLVKTVRKDEHKLLRHILPSYFRHMTKTGQPDAPDSMLTRIVGCHVVRSSKRSKTRTGAHKVYFVVMTNALETDLEVHRKYDLKGSWIGRKTSVSAREDPGKTLKDVDLTESRDRIFVDARMKNMLMASLRRDATFLESHHIIDYSVLLGIHDHSSAIPPRAPKLARELSDSSVISRGNKSVMTGISALSSSNSLLLDQLPPPEPTFFSTYHGGFKSVDGKQTYFMGIIDFLTQYGERKRLERFVKTIAHLNSSGLSVMPARAYAKRFLNFMDKRVIVADTDRTSYFSAMETAVSTDLRHPRLDC